MDASTVSAGAFFAERRLVVPDYQRKYSWEPDEQIEEFWRDVSAAMGKGDYFLGLVVLSDEEGIDRAEVVDGQQRLVTLTILANELRLIALRLGRRLVAESLRTDFLFSMDFRTEEQVPRILLTDPRDREDLADLLRAETQGHVPAPTDSAILRARAALAQFLNADIDGHAQPALRVGMWTEFLTKNLTFAVFTHPDRSAAFRVYEVVNTRGKDLTPTELIKSHLIGTSESETRDQTYARWSTIESQLESVFAADQLTTFVRHVVTLERGYVIPRELYQEVSSTYTGPNGVDRLLTLLEKHISVYLQMIDPAADVESSDVRTRSYAILGALSASRFRPILLAAAASDDPDEVSAELVRILFPGLITGRFGSGSFEAQFARIARNVYATADWTAALSAMRALMPTGDELRLRFTRGVNKSQALVVRSMYLQGTPLPELVGYPHQIRPRNGEDWPDFGNDDYKDVGGLIANWVLATTERRPQGTRTPDTVLTKLVPHLLDREPLTHDDVLEWTAHKVATESTLTADRIVELLYGTD